MEFLERIRNKPLPVRARFAFGGALGVTLLIATIWSTTLPTRFGQIGANLKEEGSQNAAVQNSFDQVIQDVQNNIVPEAEEPEAQDPEVKALEIGTMEGLEGWNRDVLGTSTKEEKNEEIGPTQAPASAISSPNREEDTPQKETVILIGTTTKKTQ